MTAFSANVNKIATVRNTRSNGVPDLARLAALILDAGADGITIHPRPDERHIRAADVAPLAALVRRYDGAEFNIEGNPFEGRFMEHCLQVRPTQATLVPDVGSQSTSDHGFDLAADGARLRPRIAELKAAGIRVSVFMDPIGEAMLAARAVGADRIELYTEPFAAAFAGGDRGPLAAYVGAARAARAAGLGINAGHDLNLDNLGPFLRAVPNVDEVSIGHALIADFMEFGVREAVARYAALCRAT